MDIKHSDEQIIRVVGNLIAKGAGKYRPRLHADDFHGRVIIQGQAYYVRLRWPDGAEVHEVRSEIRPLGRTTDKDSVDVLEVRGF